VALYIKAVRFQLLRHFFQESPPARLISALRTLLKRLHKSGEAHEAFRPGAMSAFNIDVAGMARIDQFCFERARQRQALIPSNAKMPLFPFIS
jgi:hypothetical protein